MNVLCTRETENDVILATLDNIFYSYRGQITKYWLYLFLDQDLVCRRLGKTFSDSVQQYFRVKRENDKGSGIV